MCFLAYRTGGNQIHSEQSKNADHKSLENSVFICQFSAVGRQMAVENSVLNDLRTMPVNSINVVNCRLSEVFIEYTEYVVKTIRNKGY